MKVEHSLNEMIQVERKKQEKIRLQVQSITKMKKDMEREDQILRQREAKRIEEERKSLEEQLKANSNIALERAFQSTNQELNILKMEFEIQELGRKPIDFAQKIDNDKKYAGGCGYCPINYPLPTNQNLTAEYTALYYTIENKQDFERKYDQLSCRRDKLFFWGIQSLNGGCSSCESPFTCLCFGGCAYLAFPHLACYHCFVGLGTCYYRSKSRLSKILQIYDRCAKRMVQPIQDVEKTIIQASNMRRLKELISLKEQKKKECENNISRNDMVLQLMNARLQTLRLQFLKAEQQGEDILYDVAQEKKTDCCLTTSGGPLKKIQFSAQYLTLYFQVANTTHFYKNLDKLRQLNTDLGSCYFDCCVLLSNFCVNTTFKMQSQCSNCFYLMYCYPCVSLICFPMLFAYQGCESSCNSCYRGGRRVETLLQLYEEFDEQLTELYVRSEQ